MKFRVDQTTPATKWQTISSFPHVFQNGNFPKALFMNDDDGVTVLVDQDGNSGAFTLAAGVPIQLRPSEITSTGVTSAVVIALFD